MTYREAVSKGAAQLKAHGVLDAGTDAWLLLASVCGIDKNFYYLHMHETMPEADACQYESLLLEREKRIPLQYITGEQEFMGLRFLVNSDVLIPRFDTEILVEEALKRIRGGMDVLDLCTGSGCIIVSLKKLSPHIHAAASDVSASVLLVARENARRNGVQVRFLESDLFSEIDGKFDVIVSNPPYIPTEEIASLMPEVREFEPFLALDGKADGLFFYRAILAEGKSHLKRGGILLLEIGAKQGKDVSALMRACGYQNVEVKKDLAGLDRVVIGEMPVCAMAHA